MSWMNHIFIRFNSKKRKFHTQGGKMYANYHAHIMANRSVLIVVLLLCISINLRTTRATGVFELELISLKQIDLTTNRLNDIRPNAEHHHHHSNSTNLTASEPPINDSTNSNNNFVRVFVCLKEAFTSKLDGPCTFGNASITLNRDSIQQEYQVAASTTPPSQTNQDHHNQAPSSNKQIASQQQQLSQGSLMTNVVRILFTFRWTKSFTIILTAEQIDEDADNQQQPSSPPAPHHPVAAAATIGQNYRTAAQVGRHNGATTAAAAAAANATTIIDLSATGQRSRHTQPRGNQVPGKGQQVVGAASNKSRFIDRHVLTENEVLPNLEPNPNKPWASRYSRSLKSSLAYRFRIYCSLNYYGDGCTTFCRPRDDQFGHFNCSSTGQKVCLDGWHGLDCDKARCRSGCNQQHGYCEKPDTCQCRPGWIGLRCDECITYPGCQNGYCLSPWQCICERNWGGVLCDQDLNYCGTHDPCKNNGTCQNIAPGKYKCTCPEGFTGVDCDINLDLLQDAGKMTQLSAGCALNPCLNGGTCFGFNNSPFEARTPVDPTDGIIIGSNHDHSERIYRCQCAPGWTGDYCQWSDINTMLITSLILNTTELESSSRPSYQGQLTNTTASAESVVTISTNESISLGDGNRGDEDSKNAKLFTNLIEGSPAPPPLLSASPHHLDMKHLISGVVIASVFGVFLASLLLAWCCLVAIERNKFPFIQMNIIRRGEGCEENGLNEPVVSSTLRRMHGKIRDSLRLPSRSSRIKPETKLSIENVLRPPRPPPSYEESSSYGNCQHINRISIGCPIYHRS